jgi:hypothetical protein
VPSLLNLKSLTRKLGDVIRRALWQPSLGGGL